MKINAGKVLFLGILIATAFGSVACHEVDNVRQQLSDEADNLNIQRRLTVINNRTDTVLFEMEGTFALGTSDRDELEIIVAVGEGQYKRHFVRVSDETTYVMEDISGATADPYHYEITFLPEYGLKATIEDKE